MAEANVHAAIAELRAAVGAANVLTSPDELLVYECDGFYVARGTPTAVVFPADTSEVARCVKVLARHGVPMVPRGSGTGLAGGCVAFCGEILISTVRMTRIESIDLANRLAVVQAGVLNLSLSEAVAAAMAAQPQTWPCIGPGAAYRFSPDPSSQHAATIGGNAATNAGGVNTLKHGVTTNHVLGMEVVLPDGQVLLTRAASLYDGVGPDLPGLLCGSEGTLGIITRLWCRLVPRPVSFRTVYGVFGSTVDACRAVSDVIATGLIPTSMEMMDGAMIRVVEDAFHYGFPIDAQALLLIEIDGIETLLDGQLEQVIALCRSNHARNVEHCSDALRRTQLWSARKRAFGAIGRMHVAYFTQDACVPRSELPEALARITQIAHQHGMQISNVFHAGDGNVHPIFFFDENDPAQVQRAMRAAAEVLAYCVDIGGTITGEHGVGVEKIHMMPKMFSGQTIHTFQRIKEAFDPEHRLNDGKLIPSRHLQIRLLDDGPDPRGRGRLHRMTQTDTPNPTVQTTGPEELCSLVHRCAEERLPLVDYGVAHEKLGNSPPPRHVRLCQQGQVLQHWERDFTVRVAAGAALGGVQRTLRAAGQFLPLEADEDVSIGEIINHNVYGPLRAGFGAARDLLLGLRYVDAQGREIHVGGRTVKNVAGYDVTRLMVGSLGELGVIYEATFRTYATPPQIMSVTVGLDDPAQADRLLPQWLLTDAAPAYLSLGRDAGRWTLHVGYFGSSAACNAQLQSLETLVEQALGMHILASAPVSLRDDDVARAARRAWRRDASAVVKIIVPPSSTGGIAAALADAQDLPNLHLEAYPVHGVLFVGGSVDRAGAARLDELISELLAEVGGLRVWQARPPGAESIKPFAPPQPDWPMLAKLKRVLDPQGIFNPGRFLPVEDHGQ